MGIKHADPIRKELEATPGPGAFDPYPERMKQKAPSFSIKPIISGPKTE
jgi:hypothetical protein